MRITGGILKGRRIATIKQPDLRPTRALVREAFFSSLGQAYCQRRIFVDFFSGSGIMALEALSRGAAMVYCIEPDFKTARQLRLNFTSSITKTITADFKILPWQAEKAVDYFARQNINIDIAYLDPPYQRSKLMAEQLLADSLRAGIFKPGARIAYEHPDFNDSFKIPPSMRIDREKKYGITHLTMMSFNAQENELI